MLDFSRIRYNSSIGRALRAPLQLIPKQIAIPILQGRMRGKRWIVGSSTHGCWLGSQDAEKQNILTGLVSEGETVFDLGAHVGYYTLLASTLVGKQGRVVAFEPAPENLSYLNRHIALNGLENVTVIDAAVSDQAGEIRFTRGDNSSAGSIAANSDSEENGFTVRTLRLDDLVNSGELPVPNVVKMDIEGAEAKALLGMKEILARSRPVLFLATHGEKVRAECMQILESVGYKTEAVPHQDWQIEDEYISRFAG